MTLQSHEWKQARRTAFVQEVLGVLMQRPAALLSFEHVHERLQLENLRYLDLQDVPINQIVVRSSPRWRTANSSLTRR